MDCAQISSAGDFMNFSVENLFSFYLFIPLVFALLFVVARYIRLRKNIGGKVFEFKNGSFRISACFWSRTFFRFICGICVVLALAGISFGTDSVPVQKNGKAVSLGV